MKRVWLANGVLIVGAVILFLVAAGAAGRTSIRPDVWLTLGGVIGALGLVALTLLFCSPAAKANAALLLAFLVVPGAAGYLVLDKTGPGLVSILETKIWRRIADAQHGKREAPTPGPPATPAPAAAPAKPEPKQAAINPATQGTGEAVPATPVYLDGFSETWTFLRDKKFNVYRANAVFPLLPAVEAGKTNGFLPLSGRSLVPTMYCNEGDQNEWPIYRADRYGFNNDDVVYDWDRDRVLIVGDSFAHGACVHQEQNVSGVLRRNGYAAFTIGLGGHGPLLYLAALTEYGSVLKPKAVLWFYFDGNDVTDLRDREGFVEFLQRYLVDSAPRQNLAGRQVEVDAFWDEVQLKPGHPWIAGDWASGLKAIQEKNAASSLKFYRSLPGLADIGSISEKDDLVRIFTEIVRTARDRVAGWGGQLYFVVIPNMDDYKGAVPPYRLPVMTSVAKLGIPIVDVDRALRAESGGWMFQFYPTYEYYGHLNTKGYEVMSREIMRHLRVERSYPRTPFVNVQDATYRPQCAAGAGPAGNATQAMVALCNGKMNCVAKLDAGPLGQPGKSCPNELVVNWTCHTGKNLRTATLPAEGGTVDVNISCPMPGQ